MTPPKKLSDNTKQLQAEFEKWWKEEGRAIVKNADVTESKGTATAFIAGARAMRKILAQRPRGTRLP
jgi:hypothetical protein